MSLVEHFEVLSVVEESVIDVVWVYISVDEILEEQFAGFEIRGVVVVALSMNLLKCFLEVFVPEDVAFEFGVFEEVL